MTARELSEHGDDVTLIVDGAGTEGLATLAEPEHSAHALLQSVRNLIGRTCYYCSGAVGVRNKPKVYQYLLLRKYTQHPSLRALLEKGLLTF